MDASTKKMGVIAAGAAVLAVAASIVTTKIVAPSAPAPAPAASVPMHAAERTPGSVEQAPTPAPAPEFVSEMFDGDLEMPHGTNCKVVGAGSGRTAACVTRDGRLFDCGYGSAWGCWPSDHGRKP